ncbi:hypothetical protein PNOK_0206700 [Pyrrhoderma noxium]|uniref:Uncharacterized protein n=1 Tax=Pyrrhoderma noxium TaxID=2282107 RepID=A0A286UR99_9AGAM|nr:hypothetical protein PNOK_0206700 [Pyrrhoderma noxium]
MERLIDWVTRRRFPCTNLVAFGVGAVKVLKSKRSGMGREELDSRAPLVLLCMGRLATGRNIIELFFRPPAAHSSFPPSILILSTFHSHLFFFISNPSFHLLFISLDSP